MEHSIDAGAAIVELVREGRITAETALELLNDLELYGNAYLRADLETGGALVRVDPRTAVAA